GSFICSKNKLHLTEQIEKRLARIDVDVVRRAKLRQVRRTIGVRSRIDVAKAPARLQSRRPKRQRQVIDQQRPVRDAQTQVPTNLVSNIRLKQNVFKRLSAMKSKIVYVDDSL